MINIDFTYSNGTFIRKQQLYTIILTKTNWSKQNRWQIFKNLLWQIQISLLYFSLIGCVCHFTCVGAISPFKKNTNCSSQNLCFESGKSNCCMIAVLNFILGEAGGGASGIDWVVVVVVVMVGYFWWWWNSGCGNVVGWQLWLERLIYMLSDDIWNLSPTWIIST